MPAIRSSASTLTHGFAEDDLWARSRELDSGLKLGPSQCGEWSVVQARMHSSYSAHTLTVSA